MTEEQKEILKKAYIPEEMWDKCFISPEGMIFTPNGDKTGKECYDEWKYAKEHPEAKPPTELEQLKQQYNALSDMIITLTGGAV